MLLHELYFASLQGGGAAMVPAMKLALDANFGSVQRWREEFVACAKALGGGSGWVLLTFQVGAGAITGAGLPDEHVDDERFAARVDAALAAGSPALLYGTWTAWKDAHLRHLAHEEEIVTPLTMKTAPTPQARGRIVHERILTPTQAMPDFDWSIGWVVRRLSEFGSTAQPPQVATRVFAWGLQNACSQDQWRRLRPIVQRNCAAAIWAEMASKFGLDGEGAIA